MTTIGSNWQGKRIKIANGMSLWRLEDISIKRQLVFIGRSWLNDPSTEETCIGQQQEQIFGYA